MSESKCKCKHPASSIHGVCNTCGNKLPQKYNLCPQEPQSASTARGKRRAANRTKKS